jgi:hypothetical protein
MGAVLSNFFIKGDCNEVCAGLKATLDAQDANFKAQLAAAVKLAPPPQRAPVTAPAPKQQAPAVKPSAWTGKSLGTNRSRRFS